MQVKPSNRNEVAEAVLIELAKLPQWRRIRFIERHFPGRIANDITIQHLHQLDDDSLMALGRFLDLEDTSIVGWPEPGLRIFASHLSSTRGRFSQLKIKGRV